MKNVLIVESKNDKFFIEALIKHLNLNTLEVSKAVIYKIEDFEFLNGLDSNKLNNALDAAKLKLNKSEFPKLGVLIDQDNKTVQERLQLLNNSIKEVFEIKENALKAINQLFEIKSDNFQSFNIATHFTNIDGKGNLETVLRTIKSQSSVYADCLQSWQDCLIKNKVNNSEGIKPVDFEKLWVQFYIRFDTCSVEEQKQAGRKCTNEPAMKKPIWDFEHPSLENLKSFLKLFS